MRELLAVSSLAVATTLCGVAFLLLRVENARARFLEEELKRSEAQRRGEVAGRKKAEKAAQLLATNGRKGPGNALVSLHPIGYVRSCFIDCQGTPRQPGLTPASRAIMMLEKGVSGDSLTGLAQHSHVWVILILIRLYSNPDPTPTRGTVCLPQKQQHTQGKTRRP